VRYDQTYYEEGKFMNYWLLKTEPETFGIRHLEALPNQVTAWEGVRNYQARNLLRDCLQEGDLAFFYHSSCKVPGIAGIVKVVRSGYPDISAFDPNSHYYDPKSLQENPRWYVVDVKLVQKFRRIIPLAELRRLVPLRQMVLLKTGNRLSVMPVTEQEWQTILAYLSE
jgi:predicted RNA-binding protein with PUA-like domain